MRLCAGELLAAKSESPAVDNRLSDWDEIGAINFAEWGVWFFEGIALHAKGDKDAGNYTFGCATLNLEFAEPGRFLG